MIPIISFTYGLNLEGEILDNSFQWSGSSSLFQINLMLLWISDRSVSPPAWISSAGILSLLSDSYLSTLQLQFQRQRAQSVKCRTGKDSSKAYVTSDESPGWISLQVLQQWLHKLSTGEWITERVGRKVIILTCILDVFGSILGRESHYSLILFICWKIKEQRIISCFNSY
jgi:hypothetical protein